MERICHKIRLIIILLVLSTYGMAQSLFAKEKIYFFELDSTDLVIPYSTASTNIYQINDSTVFDIRFKKLFSKLIITSYNKNEFYSNKYASPISLMKYKTGKARLDSGEVDFAIDGEVYKGKTSYNVFDARLIKRIDYFKYKSK